jgi:hypothetical protein
MHFATNVWWASWCSTTSLHILKVWLQFSPIPHPLTTTFHT